MSLRSPERHDDLANFRVKRLLLLGGAPAVRICEGEFGIARQQWRLLAALVEHGEASPTELARSVGMDQARASRTLASLVDKRLVHRTTDSKDRRRASVAATAAGIALYARLFPRLAEVNARLVSVLTDDELATFEACLEKLTAQAMKVLLGSPASHAKADRRQGGSRRVWSEQATHALPRA